LLSNDLRTLKQWWNERLRSRRFNALTGPEVSKALDEAILKAEHLERTCVAQATRLARTALAGPPARERGDAA
jgi:hypothetical protein